MNKIVNLDTGDSDLKLSSIVYPYASEKMDDVRKCNKKFVHYTNASSGISILKSNCVWLRNSLLMNDYSEVRYGLLCLEYAWHNKKLGDKLIKLIDDIDPFSSSNISYSFDSQINILQKDSYFISMSEHLEEENGIGRLSMWRAYGSPTGVALVLNNTPFISTSDALQAYTSPVLYADPDGFCAQMERTISSIEDNKYYLKEVLPPGDLAAWIHEVLCASVLSTKHLGFCEEREWRVIYNPKRAESEHVKWETQCISGVPQRIYKIPFVNYPDEGLVGATIPEILNHVIIGPTAYPDVIADAYQDVLTECGVTDAANKVFVSAIPLRQ